MGFKTIGRRIFGLGLGTWLLVALFAWPVFAAVVTAQYETEEPLAPGMLVSSVPDQEGFVAPTDLENASRVFGVVVNFEEALIAVGDDSAGTVQVAHDGVVDVLVSDLSGNIAEGDALATSPLVGIAQKADRQSVVIGTAKTGFDGAADETAGTADIKTENGDTKTVNIGRVSVQFEVSANPGIDRAGRIPSALQGIADTIGGKPVSAVRIVVALVVLMVTLLVSGVLLYTAIHTALVAIGRNPLSRGGVYRALFQVFGIVGVVTFVGLGTIYLILRT